MADFAEHADSYRDDVAGSIAFSGTEHEFFVRRKADALVDLAERLLGDPSTLSVLDVGCGVGLTDQHLVARVGALHGTDVAPEVVAQAATRNPGVGYLAYDGRVLPHEAGTFDLAFAICVAHHVEVEDRPGFAAELARVVRPGGLVVVFEHNPYNPLTRLAVSRCEFDDGVVLLARRTVTGLLEGAGLDVVEARYLLFTTIDRAWAVSAERPLRGVPLGAQHYVAARVPSGSG